MTAHQDPVGYRDRAVAGEVLARALRGVPLDDPVVLALPRGGVPVAVPVARSLGAPLDVLLVRKIGVPGHRELGVGAIGEGRVRILDTTRIRQLGLDPAALEPIIAEEQAELVRRVTRYRAGRMPIPLEGRDVVVVDDGIATGGSALTAVEVVRRRRPGRIVLAAPVGASEGVRRLGSVVDRIVCPRTVAGEFAVAAHYVDFGQVEDAEVVALLEAAQDR
jgi:putative phosphoribosyl transferase